MLILDLIRSKDPVLRVVTVVILAGLAVLLAGLFQVQVLSAQKFKVSQVSQSFRTVRLPAIRGQIRDRNGVALADNRPAYQVNLYLEELRPYFQSTYAKAKAGKRYSVAERLRLEQLARYHVVSNLVFAVGTTFDQTLLLSEPEFRTHYDQRRALPLPVATDLEQEQLARFLEQSATLPGCDLEAQPARVYPYGSTAAHVLGYLRRDDRYSESDVGFHYRLPDFSGIVGIEGVFDTQLRGQPGMKSVLVNSLGYRQSESIWTPTDPGDHIGLTIDLGVQQAAERALQSAGPYTRGAVIVMDVRNGDVLAMASAPAFDPNQFFPRIGHTDWARLNDPVMLPLINRATYGAYAPGSIFKIVVGLAGLEAGAIHPDERYASPGYFQLGRAPRGRRIRDLAEGGRPAEFDFKKALKLSSNAYFIHHGLILGPDKLLAFCKRLHLGEKTGSPTGQEVSGILPSREWQAANVSGWHDGDTANLCIGQGYLSVTPMQMAVLTAAIANGGTVYWPRLVSRIEPQPASPEVPARVFPPGRVRNTLGVSRANLEIVQRAMLADVEDRDGTGRRAAVPGLRICGKTGTAQITRGREVIDHTTWFVSYAPYSEPRHAVVVMVESGAGGGETCAPIARQVYEAILRLEQQRVGERSLARNQ
jgi:penicillin-binding protein 2